jgi:3-oxoacyl-(acyl-carrier-protein) synthase III
VVDERRATRIGGRPTTIKSLATYVPPRVLSNADLERMVDTTDEWILQRTGIRERHIVDPGVATSDLGKEAAIKAIANAGLTPDDIGLIIVGTVTPDMMFPSTACLIQQKIGARHTWGFDLSAACSAFTYALTTASQLVATGSLEHALVVGADVMSSIIDYQDRSTCVLFGDGAGAVVVSPAEEGGGAILDFDSPLRATTHIKPLSARFTFILVRYSSNSTRYSGTIRSRIGIFKNSSTSYPNKQADAGFTDSSRPFRSCVHTRSSL